MIIGWLLKTLEAKNLPRIEKKSPYSGFAKTVIIPRCKLPRRMSRWFKYLHVDV